MSNHHQSMYLSKKQLAKLLGISHFTIDNWVSERREIPFIKMGRRVMFDRRDIQEWLAGNKFAPVDFIDRPGRP